MDLKRQAMAFAVAMGKPKKLEEAVDSLFLPDDRGEIPEVQPGEKWWPTPKRRR